MWKPTECPKCGKPFITPGWDDEMRVLSKIIILRDGVKASKPFVRCSNCYTETFVEKEDE